jgi:TolA-binding protein
LKENGDIDDSFKKARHFFNQKDFRRAEENYQAYLLMSSDSVHQPDALYESAHALYSLGRYDEAIAQFKRVIVDFPGSPLATDSIFKAVFTEEALARWDSAIQDLRNFITQFPSSPDIRQARYSIVEAEADKSSFDQGALSQAIADLEIFHRVYPDDNRASGVCKQLETLLTPKSQPNYKIDLKAKKLADICAGQNQ